MYFGKVRVGVALFITATTIMLSIRDLFIAPEHRAFWLLKYVPQWSWQAWMLIGLVGLLLLTLEGSYSKFQRDQIRFRGAYRAKVKGHRDRSRFMPRLLPISASTKLITKEVEIAPNLQPLTPEMVEANRQENGVIVSGQVFERLDHFWNEESKNLAALVLPFHNRIVEGQEIGTADNISGRISLYSYESNAAQEADRIAWIDEEFSRVYFGRNDTHRLMVLTLEGTEAEPRFYINKHAAGSRRSGNDRIDRFELSETGAFRLNISLIDEGKSKVIKKGDYILELQAKPELQIGFEPIKKWRQDRLEAFYRPLIEFVETFMHKTKEERNHPPPEVNKTMLDCKAFAAKYIGNDEAKSLGVALSERATPSPFEKALVGEKDAVDHVLAFLHQITDLMKRC